MNTHDSLPSGNVVSTVENGTAGGHLDGLDSDTPAILENDLGTSLVREVNASPDEFTPWLKMELDRITTDFAESVRAAGRV